MNRDEKSFSYYTYEQDFSNKNEIAKETGLTWNVIVEDVNRRKIIPYNIFEHGSFAKALIINNKRYEDDEEFADQIRRQVMYYFWSKSEWEFIATSWPPYIDLDELDRLNKEKVEYKEKYETDIRVLNVSPTVGEKLDVADQVLMNWQAFKQYLLTNRKYIRKILPDYLK